MLARILAMILCLCVHLPVRLTRKPVYCIEKAAQIELLSSTQTLFNFSQTVFYLQICPKLWA